MNFFRRALPSPVELASRLHDWLSNFANPQRGNDGADMHDISGRLATLFLLASLFVPFFVFEFAHTGYPMASVMVTIAGGVMLSALWIYRVSGSHALAREVFLGSLFGFILWEAFYFGSIYSPGTAWLVVMPVVSVLLGSIRAGVIWLGLVCITLAALFALTGGAGGELGVVSERYGLLYTISIGSAAFAIFLFVLMVDGARAEAYRGLEAANAAIRDLAERDELTGLFNRRALEKLLQDAVESRGTPDPIIVLVIDLDGFKEINDTYGHHIGDKLIQVVSAGLLALSQKHNSVPARLGGDEFAIIITGPEAPRRSREIAEEALAFVRQPIDIDGRSAGVGMSIGLASSSVEIDAPELLRRADVAMYEAKRQGRRQFCEYQDKLDARRGKRVALAAELAAAVEHRRIAVHYQPIVDARTRNVLGVEALARWTDLGGKPVAPDEFIPVAEESGLINKLGLYVLETACRDAANWPTVRLSVNLSPVQFRSATLVEDILLILERTAFSADRLELEVTEGYLIDHSERVQPLIERLRAAGITIALDDFGTGYSSIGYLRQYQFDRLKIDKSLIRGIAADAGARSIIEATAILARSLSLDLTAEGVETEEQAKLLRLAGCSSLQGYHFGRPQPAEAITDLLAERNAVYAVAHA